MKKAQGAIRGMLFLFSCEHKHASGWSVIQLSGESRLTLFSFPAPQLHQ